MEMVLALAIGVLTGSGVWLLLRPRTFQVIMGLSLLSYAVNLFIFSMGSLSINDGDPMPGRGHTAWAAAAPATRTPAGPPAGVVAASATRRISRSMPARA